MEPNTKPFLSALLGMGIFLGGCTKEFRTGRMTLRLTDAPANYSEVNVEILRTEVHYSNEKEGENGWVEIPTKAGVYNLLTLQNDITTIIAEDGELPAGKISQFRMILGEKNSVVVDSISYPMEVPSADKTGIKINVDSEIKADQDLEIVLDFDAYKSVVLKGNGSFALKPTIKVKSVNQK